MGSYTEEICNLTALPLDDFRRIMGIDPWHFWQMDQPNGCAGVTTHYRWINTESWPGRFDYVQALIMAEQQLAQKLDYWPGLLYTNNEIVRLVTPRQPVLYNHTPMKLETHWHHVQATGLITRTLIIAGYALAYGGSDDVVLVQAVPAGTVASEIDVCYPGTHHSIRPISVVISAGAATVTIKKWLLGDPDLWTTNALLDPADASDMLATVDIYRVTYDNQHAILLAWEPEIQWCGCLNEDCVVCSNATHVACAVRGDYKNGLVGWQAAEYVNSGWLGHAFPSSRWPDMAYINYLHGADTGNDRYMSPYWGQIVSHFAVSLMDEAGCGCTNALSQMRYWAEDMGLVKESSSHTLGPVDTDNPYGPRRGQIAAWKAVLMHVGD